MPRGAPPKKLENKELEEGSGAEAKSGDEVTVQYVGVDYKTGKKFDSSWSRSEPFSFTLGAGEVIPGWDQGVEGMKVGGRRELIIPPELAYGASRLAAGDRAERNAGLRDRPARSQLAPARSATTSMIAVMAAARLTAQGLSGPPLADPVAVAERLLAVQGQDPRGAGSRFAPAPRA